MHPDLLVPLAVTLSGAVVVLLATTIGFGVAWIRARDRARRAERDLLQQSATPEGLERIAQAVDAIAIEVERISEAERFQSQLLARGQSAQGERLPGAPGRTTTPH